MQYGEEHLPQPTECEVAISEVLKEAMYDRFCNVAKNMIGPKIYTATNSLSEIVNDLLQRYSKWTPPENKW